MEYWSYGIKERVYESMSARVYETMRRPDREGALRALECWSDGIKERV